MNCVVRCHLYLYVLNFSKSTILVPQLGNFFNIKTTEYLNKLVEICRSISDDKKCIKVQILYTETKVNIGRSTVLQTACIHL